MDNANMSPSSDNENSSDDLIAELARLMAAEAQGESKQQATQTAPEAGFSPQAETRPVAPAEDRLTAEPVFASRSESPRHAEQHDDLTASHIPTGASYAPDEPAQEQRFAPPSAEATPVVESDSFAEMPAEIASAAPVEPTNDRLADDDFKFEMPPLRPVEDVDVGRAPEVTPAPRPAAPEFAARPAAPVPAPAPVEPAPMAYQSPEPVAQQPAMSEDMDPIGALIAAQLEEADAFQPGMAPDETITPNRQRDDTFGVAPVFGLGGAKSADTQPKVARDPLDDIESLIGAALRTEPGQAPVAGVQPAPVEPGIVGAADAAEAAILAATATMRRSEEQDAVASSASGSVDFDAESEQPRLSARNDWSGRPKSNWKKIASPLVAAALLLAVGLGVYWVFGTGNQVDGEAPVLSADTSPVKQAPDTSSTSTDTPRSVVFAETGSDSQPDTIEQLISRDETTDVQGNDVARVITPDAPQDGGLANRKVRTVTVRPDGTIVSGEAAVAGGEQLPVERPNVPQLPGGVVASPVVTTTTPVDVATTQTGEIPPVPQARPTRTSAPSVPTTVPVTTTTPLGTTNLGGNASAVDLIANTANQAVRQPQAAVQAAPAQTATPFAVASGSSAPAYVQLSSQRTPDAANRSLNEVKSRYADQLGGNELEVQQVDLGERGIFFRVRMPAQSVENANSVCANIKASGGDCFVRTD